jgi:hypothetical protein
MASTFWKGLLLVGLALAASALVPGERVLGRSIGIVYLHGAWVWTALAGFAAAALAGLVGLSLRLETWNRWSIALGQTGALYWITYLPLSLWAMRATWGGLYLAEPRWRLGVNFALAALMLQAAVLLINRPAWASALNLVFFAALSISVASTQAVLHPPSPVFSSGSVAVKVGFLTILGLCLGAAYCLARVLRARHV